MSVTNLLRTKRSPVSLDTTVFVPSSTPTRLSFAWLDRTQVQAKVVGQQVTTIVVLWPTMPNGRVDLERLHHARAALWHITPHEVDQLAHWADFWPADRADYLVGIDLTPCRDSLRVSETFQSPALQDHIERLVRSLTG